MFKKYLSCFIVLFLLSNCSGALKNREISKNLYNNVKQKNYEEALKNAKDENYYADENAKLLKKLDIGTVYYLQGNYYQALRYFEEAKKISDDLYTISIKKKLQGTWDANLDNYYGERYERSMIRFYLSLINYNLYKQGFYEEYKDEDGELVAKRQMTDAERRFHFNYSRSAIIEWDSLLQTMQNESMGQDIYKNDMMAKLWGAYIHTEYNTSNDRQIALQLYKDADELLLRNYNSYPIFNNKSEKFNKDFEKLPNITYQQLQKDYIDETEYSKKLKEYITRNRKNLEKYKKDNVVVLVKDNLISPKEVDTFEIPFPITSFGPQGSDLYEFARLVLSTREGMPYVLIEFPKIEIKDKQKKYEMVIFDKNNDEVASTELTLIEPLSDIAKKTLDDELLAIKASIITRITGKYIAAIAAGYALYSQGDTVSMVSALAGFKASSKLINETSRADIRYWTTLYSNALMGGVKIEDGEYKIQIKSDGNIVLEKNILVEKGKTTFLDLNF